MRRCRNSTLVLLLVAVVMLPGCAAKSALTFGDPPAINPSDRLRCDVGLGDKSDVRACLVPKGGDADETKQVGRDCYWRKFDSKNVKFHVKANGNNRRFTFEVVNLCTDPVSVHMTFAPVQQDPILEFVTAGCALEDQQEWSVQSQGNAVTACDSQRYKQHGSKLYSREVKFYVVFNETNVYFDPEIGVKDAG